jgi:hypothetical protein
MGTEKDSYEYLHALMQDYKMKIKPLTDYLPWLQQATEKAVVSEYKGDGISAASITFPVYSADFMGFIKACTVSGLMDRNYPYTYSRRRLDNHDAERRAIIGATWKEWDVLCGILSKYVLGGRTRASLWKEGISEQIFYLTVSKMQEITDFWEGNSNL